MFFNLKFWNFIFKGKSNNQKKVQYFKSSYLEMLLHYYGNREHSIEDIAKVFDEYEGQSKILQMNKCVEHLGFEPEMSIYDMEDLRCLMKYQKEPCLAYIKKYDYFLILKKMVRRRGKYFFYLKHPLEGKIVYNEEEMMKEFIILNTMQNDFGYLILVQKTI